MQSEHWQRCVDIFDAALECSPNERSAFLDKSCAGDEGLRRQVEFLLKSDEKAEGFMESTAFQSAPELLLGESDTLLGRQFGHYRIESILGLGGMGIVYLAHDERLGRKVGLKLLPPALVADEVQLERLKSEARTASALNHPNIVTIHEIGEVDGVHYIATEHIEGVTLREHIAKGPLPPNESLGIASQLAAALGVAHEAGIVHRDIKPENIMLRRDGYVKVLDFGIAKLVQQPESLPSAQTVTTPLILGTARYMSPEQTRGLSVDSRTDIWSLGVVLYEMLVGQPPFTGETNTDVIASVLRSDAPLARSVPGELQRIIHRTLQKEPEARYQNVAELHSDLERALRKFDSRAIRARQIIAIAALAIVALGAVWLWRLPNELLAANRKSIAVLPFQNLSPDPNNAYFAEGIQNEILTRLSKIATLKVISRTSTQKYRSPLADTRKIGEQLDVANLVEGSVQKIAQVVKINVQLIRADRDEHLWAESYSRPLNDVFAVEGEVASAIAQQLNVKLTGVEKKALTDRPTQNAAAYEAYLRGIAIEDTGTSTEAPMMQAAAEYDNAVRLDPKFALAWARLGLARSFLHSWSVDVAANTPEIARAAVDHAMQTDPEAGESWMAEGAYRFRVARDYAGALEAFQKALRQLPNNSFALELNAIVERRLGQWEPALSHIREAVQLDPRNISTLSNFATAFLNPTRRFTESHTIIDRMLEIAPNDPGILCSKAYTFQREGRLAEAAQVLERIPANSTNESVLTERPRHLSYERRFEEAIAQMQRCISLSSKPGEPLAGNRLANLTLLGYYQEWAGRSQEARETFRTVIAAIAPSPEATVPLISRTLLSHAALAYAGLNEKENALAAAQRAFDEYRQDAFDGPRAQQTLAQIQARFGETDAAISAIKHLLEVPAGLTPGILRIDPFWDPLRKDARFQKLIADTPARSN